MSRFRILWQISRDLRRRVLPASHRPSPDDWSDEEVTVALLGHATVLINFYGVRILTDPVFYSRVGLHFGPLTLGPKRYIQCALRPSELPRIDIVLLSHAHMDHMDLRSLRCLRRDSIAITAAHTRDLLRWMRFRDIMELNWGATQEITTPHGAATFTAVRMRHWGARMQWDTHRGYNAYLIERNGVRMCFTCDTARTAAHELGARGPVDLMMVPISAYHPWIANHCTPEEAVEMADEAGARHLVPIHHETFKLSWEPMDEPIRRFRAALKEEPWRIGLTEIGQTFRLPTKGLSVER